MKVQTTLNPSLRSRAGLKPEELAGYKQGAQLRLKREERKLAQRQKQAWEMARASAKVLKEQFGASRVWVFGSLAHNAWWTRRSDIDLAVEGLVPGKIWRAWCAVERVCQGFEVDLVEIEAASELLRQAIFEEGVLI